MADEGVFSRQDATPAPAPTGDATTAAPDTMPGAEPSAPPTPAPGPGAAPTPDQINEWKQAYENRQSWQSANTQEAQRIAREREEVAGYKQWVEELQQSYQNDPKVRQFVDDYNKLRATGGQPTGGVPTTDGQLPAGADPALAQRLTAAEQRLAQFERARDAEWADKAYGAAQTEFQKITGRDWTPQEYMRLRGDLARTGSIEPAAQMKATFWNEFAHARGQAVTQGVANAQAVAAGAQVEGLAGGNQTQQIDLRTASDEDLDRLGRQAIGAEPDPNYNKYIWTKPK